MERESTAAQPATEHESASGVIARAAEFSELRNGSDAAAANPLRNLGDVHVSVNAELGRARLRIGEVLKLGIGSVIPLTRAVHEPVDLMVEGVCLARGEVVVVDDHFAIRIKEIAEAKASVENEPG